jgi:hypothetical protein
LSKIRRAGEDAMYDAGEAAKGVIKPEFNRSVLGYG